MFTQYCLLFSSVKTFPDKPLSLTFFLIQMINSINYWIRRSEQLMMCTTLIFCLKKKKLELNITFFHMWLNSKEILAVKRHERIWHEPQAFASLGKNLSAVSMSSLPQVQQKKPSKLHAVKQHWEISFLSLIVPLSSLPLFHFHSHFLLLAFNVHKHTHRHTLYTATDCLPATHSSSIVFSLHVQFTHFFPHVCFSALSNALLPLALLESLPTLILSPTQFQGHKAGPVAVYSLTLVPIWTKWPAHKCYIFTKHTWQKKTSKTFVFLCFWFHHLVFYCEDILLTFF